MSIHKPPTSDSERLENLLAAWGSPDSDGYDDEEDAAAMSGIDFGAWAGEIQAKVKTHVEAERRARAAAEAEAEAAARPSSTDLDARIRAEVDLAVAPYVGKTSPVVLAQLRNAAERYFREHPHASRILSALVEKKAPLRSGEVSRAPETAEDESARRKRKA